MSLLKRGRIKEIFHDAGIKRVSPNVILQLDAIIERTVEQIAEAAAHAYPDQLLDGGLLQRLSLSHGGWTLTLDKAVIDEKTLDELVAEEQLPDDLDDEEEPSGV